MSDKYEQIPFGTFVRREDGLDFDEGPVGLIIGYDTTDGEHRLIGFGPVGDSSAIEGLSAEGQWFSQEKEEVKLIPVPRPAYFPNTGDESPERVFVVQRIGNNEGPYVEVYATAEDVLNDWDANKDAIMLAVANPGEPQELSSNEHVLTYQSVIGMDS